MVLKSIEYILLFFIDVPELDTINPLDDKRSIIVTGLMAGVSYSFRVSAANELGIGHKSLPSSTIYISTLHY